MLRHSPAAGPSAPVTGADARHAHGRRLLALFGSAHPGPTIVVTLVTLGLAIAVGATPPRAALLTIGMFAGQLSVGWSNDWLDAARDQAAGRTDKPVAGGIVPIRLVRTAALVALVPAIALPAVASPPAALLHLVFIGCGWAYNLGLKATPASALTYAIAFGSLPALATLLLAPPLLPPWWATGAGAALGIAAHFANVVPDVAEDREAGVRGLPQTLGARASGVIAPAVLLVGVALIVVGAGLPATAVAIAATAVAALCSVAGLIVALRPNPGRGAFRLVMGAALALVVVLLSAGGALTR